MYLCLWLGNFMIWAWLHLCIADEGRADRRRIPMSKIERLDFKSSSELGCGWGKRFYISCQIGFFTTFNEATSTRKELDCGEPGYLLDLHQRDSIQCIEATLIQQCVDSTMLNQHWIQWIVQGCVKERGPRLRVAISCNLRPISLNIALFLVQIYGAKVAWTLPPCIPQSHRHACKMKNLTVCITSYFWWAAAFVCSAWQSIGLDGWNIKRKW